MTRRVRLADFLQGLGEFAFLGLLLGGCHAVAETTLMGWYGVRLAHADIGVILGVYGALGTAGGAMLWLFVLSAGIFAGSGAALADPRLRRLWFAVLFIPSYAILAAWLVLEAGSGSRIHAWGAGVSACAVAVLAVMVRRGADHLGMLPGFLALCFLGSGASLIAVEGALVVPEKRPLLELSVVAACAVPLSWLLFGRRSVQSRGRPRPRRRAILTLGLLAALDFALWTKVWPASIPWQPRDGPPFSATVRPDTSAAPRGLSYPNRTAGPPGAFRRICWLNRFRILDQFTARPIGVS